MNTLRRSDLRPFEDAGLAYTGGVGGHGTFFAIGTTRGRTHNRVYWAPKTCTAWIADDADSPQVTQVDYDATFCAYIRRLQKRDPRAFQ